jgi:Fe-S-cluster-containing hydrogenase component 2
MRSGVVLCVPSSILKLPQGIFDLNGRLQEKGIAVFQCNEGLITKQPGKIEEFVAQHDLEALLVISSLAEKSVMNTLQYSIERAGLGRLRAAYVDIKLLGSGNMGYITIVTNLARLEHGDYVKDAALRTALSPAKISRRQLLRSVPRALKVESDIPIVLQDRCVHRSDSCSYCVDACPVKAISPTEDTVVINDRVCIECGACARECPIGAIQGPSVSDDQVIAMLDTMSGEELKPSKPLLLLTCPIGLQKLASEVNEAENLDPGTVPVAIPCVAAIGSVHYLWAASLGVSLAIMCPDASCPRITAVLPIQRHVESSKRLLENLGENQASIQLLTLAGTDSMLDKLSPAPEQFDLKRKADLSGLRRDATLEALRTLKADKDGTLSLTGDHTLPFFDVKVNDDSCTLCEVCEKDCPDHAINFVKSDGSSSLMFDPSLCGGCKVCEKICPEGAIKVAKHSDLSEVMARLSVPRTKDENATCENCGALLGSRRGLAILEEKLSKRGSSPAILRSLHLCVRCKQATLLRSAK